MRKAIKLKYWLLENKEPDDNLPDTLTVAYDVFYEGEMQAISRRKSIKLKLTDKLVEWFLNHINIVEETEGSIEDIT